ncbi:hypothetical protein [Musicola paradisiaca]|uniref:Uncharacterized protein n=1 Tax=Musicola paradisiaca (strain Ech703) TaxID=579405 RepID=C6CBU8_MUSP7|nr:hypothetical protein [Musicola paradisiaca]ACS86708.1 conserved hypothetical protein [Musicola paradisiaca Ech703]
MAIPDIQTQNANVANFQPNLSTVSVVKNPNAVAAVSAGNKTDSSTTGDSSSDSLLSNSSTKVTLSSDGKNRSDSTQYSGSSQVSDEKAAEKKAQENKEKQQQQQQQQKEYAVERSLRMSGIPLYGGSLVSVINYPDGESEVFDAFTGKRMSAEDMIWVGTENFTDAEEAFSYYSQGLYNGMSAAEVYQQIQQMLGKGSAEISWNVIGTADSLNEF